MTEQESFFRTIIDNPDDDAPRLIFADWLEENGDPDRAEFIRLQIELMHIPEWEPRFDEIQRRVNHLLDRNGSRWQPNLQSEGRYIYQRGFVEGVFATESEFIRNVSRWAQAVPFTEIRFTSVDSSIHEILRQAHILHLRRVSVDVPNLLQVGWRSQQARECRSLTSLSLRAIGLDHNNTGLVFTEDRFPSLKRLDVSLNRIDRFSVEYVMQACPVLSELGISAANDANYNDRLIARGAHSIAALSTTQQLRCLAIRHQQIGDAGLRAIAESPNMGNLEILDVSMNEIGTIGTTSVEVLAGSSFIRNVRWLNFGGNPIGNTGLRELILWPTLKELRKLDLSSCNITSVGIRLLAGQPLHPDLRLDLTGNPIDESGMNLLTSRFGSRVQIRSAG